MSIYQKNLRRLGFILTGVAVLDLILELALYRYLLASSATFKKQILSPLGICLKDGIGLAIGLSAWFIYYHKDQAGWIIKVEILLFLAAFPAILISANGKASSRIDCLINATMILSAMAVYTALQLKRSDRNWQRVCNAKASMLDLKLPGFNQWFNSIEIGPKLELNQEISSVVDRFLETSKEARPLEITIHCPRESSEALRNTMQEVFQMHYEDEERSINSYLEKRYIRVMALVIISIILVSVWINFAPSGDEGVTWTILSNFAAFSLWQIGGTYFERSDGYGKLLRAQIAKQAKLHFWAD
ncbi:MAG: hypothetical protein K5663_05835 [Clostridiales bacterium]|nr:hypothetical protein [Clostridiales bacterium]